MSRFKMFALFAAMLSSIRHDSRLSDSDKSMQSAMLNKKSGGMLFGGPVMPHKLQNQRQKRKQIRQMQGYKK